LKYLEKDALQAPPSLLCCQCCSRCCLKDLIVAKKKILVLHRRPCLRFCTSLTPFRLFAEHSRYLYALICVDMACPSSNVTGFWLTFLSSVMVFSSSRKSSLRPTSTLGTPGQKCWTSGFHYEMQGCQSVTTAQKYPKKKAITFSAMFSSESGWSIEKHMSTTLVSGYESGRRRS